MQILEGFSLQISNTSWFLCPFEWSNYSEEWSITIISK